MADVKLTRGYDIRLAGPAEKQIADAPLPARVAVKPIEMRGIRPRLSVDIGDSVKVGTPLFHAKGAEKYRFASPASGRVAAINRGRKRVLESIVIETDGKQEAESFPSHAAAELSSLSRDQIVDQLLEAGLLALFRQRPYGNVADPDATPRDIFVSAFDSAPLAADTGLILQGNEQEFQTGLDLCARLTSGQVHLTIDGRRQDLPEALTAAKNVVLHRFSGPHPAGCVGIQIHHIAPVRNRHDIVWTVSVSGVISLGRLFLRGQFCPEVTVAVAGPAATDRRHFRTIMGASIASLVGDKVVPGQLRYVAGNVLTGSNAGADGFIGADDSLVTVLREATEPELAGWMLPGITRESMYRTFVSAFLPGRRFDTDTRLHGGRRAFIAPAYYERVLPMDIYPVYLFKSILAEDFDEMEGLGIYEVTEEEVALCEYVCPSKIEIQQLVRRGLDLIEKEG